VAAPSGRPAGRFTAEDVRPLLDGQRTVFVCGSAGFAEAASTTLVELGVPPAAIRVERFGPTGR
jgi:ferredoxin-NADP reductase